jgi:phosphoglycerate dehydrogenase-like enzyme
MARGWYPWYVAKTEKTMIIGMCGAEFPDVRDYLAEALPEAEIVILGPGAGTRADVLIPAGAVVDAGLMDVARPRLIQQFGVGLQGVDMDAARIRGIPVRNIPAADTGNAVAVAELVIFHLLALLRQFPRLRDAIRDQLVGQPIGSTLEGKTVTVLGTGAIGARVITRLEAFGAVPLGVGRSANLNEALLRSHAVVVCVPLTDQTRGMIGPAQLAAMPSGGYLVNVGRGPVVDYDALLAALRSGHLAGAGLDVAWSEPVDPGDELLKENVIVTPHIGGVTVESYAKMAAAFAASVREVLAAGECRDRSG